MTVPKVRELIREKGQKEKELRGLLKNHPEVTQERILAEMTPEEIQLMAAIPPGITQKVMKSLGIREK